MYITMSIAQLVGVGSLSLISHAVGRKDQADAQLVFEQALSLGMLIAVLFLVVGYSVGGWAVGHITSDELTATQARIYLFWYLPALGRSSPWLASAIARPPFLLAVILWLWSLWVMQGRSVIPFLYFQF